ncbi:MAG: hypothetical protein AAF591_01325 [Verrucomicrobiota bacterium]
MNRVLPPPRPQPFYHGVPEGNEGMEEYQSGAADLILRPFGMFSNVDQVVNSCYLVELGILEPFYVDGSEFLFRDAAREGNPWEYYFEQPFEGVTPAGRRMAEFTDGYLTPYHHRPEDELSILLPPRDRAVIEPVIRKYIRPQRAVVEAYEAMKAIHRPEEKGACLIRGVGKLRDMNNAAVKLHEEVYGDERYFEVYMDAMEQSGVERFIVYSDAEEVLEMARERLGDRVEWTDTRRTAQGELHHSCEEGQYELGLEMLAQSAMMADAKVFIHGPSSITNFVQCDRPELPCIDVYEEYTRQFPDRH